MAIHNHPDIPHKDLFRIPWRYKGLERIHLLLWKAVHGKLITNLERFRRHLSTSPLCPKCGTEEEYLIHCFGVCHCVAVVWWQLQGNKGIDLFSNSYSHDWLKQNLTDRQQIHTRSNWSGLFGVALDEIWRVRNDLVFIHTDCSSQVLFHRICHHAEAIQSNKAWCYVTRDIS